MRATGRESCRRGRGQVRRRSEGRAGAAAGREARRGDRPAPGSAAINSVTAAAAAAPGRPRARRGPSGGPGAARTRSRSPAAVSGLGASAGGSELDEPARPGPLGTSRGTAAPGGAPARPRAPAGRDGAWMGAAAARVPSCAADGAGACGKSAPGRLGRSPALPPADSWRSWADLVRKMLLLALACRRSAAPHPRLGPWSPLQLLVRFLPEDVPAARFHLPVPRVVPQPPPGKARTVPGASPPGSRTGMKNTP